MKRFSRISEGPFGSFSRFGGFVQVAFELAWLRARWAHRVEKVEKVAKMVGFK